MIIQEMQEGKSFKEYKDWKEWRKAFDEERAQRPLWQKIWEDWIVGFLRGSLSSIEDFLKHQKWRWQRGNRGWSDCDVWGFCDYLSVVIIGGLKQLKKELHGWPDCDEVPTLDAWEKIIDKMIRAFELQQKEMDWKKLTKEEIKEREEGMQLFTRWFNALWD